MKRRIFVRNAGLALGYFAVQPLWGHAGTTRAVGVHPEFQTHVRHGLFALPNGSQPFAPGWLQKVFRNRLYQNGIDETGGYLDIWSIQVGHTPPVHFHLGLSDTSLLVTSDNISENFGLTSLDESLQVNGRVELRLRWMEAGDAVDETPGPCYIQPLSGELRLNGSTFDTSEGVTSQDRLPGLTATSAGVVLTARQLNDLL